MSNTIIEMAARYQRIFGKPLNVVVDVTCQSACTIIMANLTKNRFNLDRREILKIMVAKDADFKFHGPSAKGSSAYVKELRDSQVFAAYLNSGTNPAWLMERKLWFKSSKMHSVSGAKLAKESSGIIPADSVRDDIDAIVAEILN